MGDTKITTEVGKRQKEEREVSLEKERGYDPNGSRDRPDDRELAGGAIGDKYTKVHTRPPQPLSTGLEVSPYNSGGEYPNRDTLEKEKKMREKYTRKEGVMSREEGAKTGESEKKRKVDTRKSSKGKRAEKFEMRKVEDTRQRHKIEAWIQRGGGKVWEHIIEKILQEKRH